MSQVLELGHQGQLLLHPRLLQEELGTWSAGASSLDRDLTLTLQNTHKAMHKQESSIFPTNLSTEGNFLR
jgi:hypothetical protein